MNRHNIWNGMVEMVNVVISILETTGDDFDLKLTGYLKGEGKT